MVAFIFLAAIAASALAKETCSSTTPSAITPPIPTSTTSCNFRLVVGASSHGLNQWIKNWAVSSYHTGACLSYAVLLPNNAGAPDYSRAFYVNGTAAEVFEEHADILTDGGTPLTPYGLIVPQANETDGEGRRPLQINCGYGTKGVGLAQHPARMLQLTYRNNEVKEDYGAWYACNTTLLYGPAMVLYFRNTAETTPEGCAAVILYPECAGNVSTVVPQAQEGACYPDVSAIDGPGS